MGKSEFVIQFGGLPVGIHEFEFQIKEKFFEAFDQIGIEKAMVDVVAVLTKQNNLLQVDFTINGTVNMECDRCMKPFDFPIENREHLVVKFGNPDESNDEILVIPEGEAEFDVSHYVYEYIMVSIPARRVPCEIDPKKFKCDKEALEKLENLSLRSEPEENENNPMWEQLNKLKNNKN